jgi:hypothetical protein
MRVGRNGGIREGMRVVHPTRGTGMVVRVAAADAVVVRWDDQVPEPGRTTFVAPLALSALSEPLAA